MPSPPHERLSRREREIIDVLFALGDRASAEEIRAGLSHPPSTSAVRAMLSRLEVKGYLRHRADGLRYIYSPIRARVTARRHALSSLVRVFFGGSAQEAVIALLKQERWTDGELSTLRAEIDRARRRRSSAPK
jgi:predicted transcriptional regulator